MNFTERIRKGMDVCLMTICVALFVLMILVGTYQIAARYFFRSPSTVSEELLTYSFAWMALFAAVYVFGKRGHMRMGFMADKLPDAIHRWLNVLIEILVLAFAAAIPFYGGIRIMQLTMSQTTPSLGIPMGIVYLAVPLSGGLTAVYCLLNLVELWQRRRERRQMP